MVHVKNFRPTSIKICMKYILVNLRNARFIISIQGAPYQFIPIAGKEIKINRSTFQVENRRMLFAFQHNSSVIYIKMEDLLKLPRFREKVNAVLRFTEPPRNQTLTRHKQSNYSIDLVIDELEQLNIKRLIDQALDHRDEKAFRELLRLL